MGVKPFFLTCFGIAFATLVWAQPDPIMPDPPPPYPDVVAEETIATVSEVMPEYPGGESALMQFLAKNIRYPQPCVDSGVEGKVYIRFIVEKDGQVANVQVLRQPQGDYGDLLAKEAVRVVRKLEKFKPGMQNGKLVRVYYTLPVTFKLTN
jgi:periplasmic protein TonB